MRLRVKQDEIMPEYLAAFLNSTLCRPQVDRAATGSSRLALDYDAIRQIRVLLPLTTTQQGQVIQTIHNQLVEIATLSEQTDAAEKAMTDVLAE